MKIYEKFVEFYAKEPETVRIWIVVGGLYMVLFGFLYLIYQYNKNSKIRLKIFSVGFFKLISKSTNGLKEYNNYLKGKKTIELKKHSDFHHLRGSGFLDSFTDGIENILIPSDTCYGICAILTANYCKIKEEVAHPLFLSEARYNLLRVFLMCNEMQLNTILSKNQDLLSKHESILDYNYKDLSSILAFIKLFFLYLYSLENPAIARNFNARDFYNFTIPQPFYHNHHVYYYNQPAIYCHPIP